MSHELLALLTLLALVGSGIMSGLFFAFSNTVIQALLELPPASGQQAMQRVNVRIINPVFLLVFMGTPVVCALLALLCVLRLESPGSIWLLSGAVAYLLGPFGVTVAFNVPLNKQLAKAQPREASTSWPAYAQPWLRWNHLRTLLSILATGLLGYGLYVLGAGQA